MIDINITLVFQLINFLIIYWLMNLLFFKPVLRVMDQRKEKLRGLTEGFSREKAEIAEIESKYQAELSAAYTQAATLKKQEKDLAEEERRKIVEKAQQEAEKLLGEKLRGIEEGFVTLEKELDGAIPELGSSLLSRALREKAG